MEAKRLDKNKILSLALLTVMLVMFLFVSSAKAVTWVEVARQSGSAFPDLEQFSMQFECSHVEWRIRWSYDAVGDPPFESLLIIKKDGDLIVYSNGYFDDAGVRNIHNEAGNFTLEITCVNMYEYTIIIEQDIDSIPEFTPTTIIIALVTVLIFAVGLSKKLRNDRKHLKNSKGLSAKYGIKESC